MPKIISAIGVALGILVACVVGRFYWLHSNLTPPSIGQSGRYGSKLRPLLSTGRLEDSLLAAGWIANGTRIDVNSQIIKARLCTWKTIQPATAAFLFPTRNCAFEAPTTQGVRSMKVPLMKSNYKAV